MKPERGDTLWQGLIVGLIGYAAVALFFAIYNLAAGRSPFYTAALFGGALFYGLRDASQVNVWPGAVLAYNGVHLLVFLVLGMIAAWLAYLAERGPQFWYIGAIVFAFVVFHMFGAALFLTAGIRAVIPTWSVFVATMLAGSAMLGYLFWMHPHFRDELRYFRED